MRGGYLESGQRACDPSLMLFLLIWREKREEKLSSALPFQGLERSLMRGKLLTFGETEESARPGHSAVAGKELVFPSSAGSASSIILNDTRRRDQALREKETTWGHGRCSHCTQLSDELWEERRRHQNRSQEN